MEKGNKTWKMVFSTPEKLSDEKDAEIDKILDDAEKKISKVLSAP